MLLQFMNNRGAMDVASILYLLFGYAVLILLIMPVHELAHAFAAHLCGDDTAKWHGRLTLNPFKHLDVWGTVMMLTVGIGYAKPVPVNPRNFRHYKRDMILVALAGPLSNLLLAVAAVAVFRVSLFFVTDELVFDALWLVLIDVIASVNISLMVFNLLPIPPLDGSRLWSSLLPGKWAYVLERNSRYITMGLFALLMLGVLDGPLTALHNAVFNLLFALFGF
ncbi:MAG: site-2 protease family protein [Clostridia bacterium]|nr:site-2 protease family protein [Clostridia bacterium]